MVVDLHWKDFNLFPPYLMPTFSFPGLSPSSQSIGLPIFLNSILLCLFSETIGYSQWFPRVECPVSTGQLIQTSTGLFRPRLINSKRTPCLFTDWAMTHWIQTKWYACQQVYLESSNCVWPEITKLWLIPFSTNLQKRFVFQGPTILSIHRLAFQSLGGTGTSSLSAISNALKTILYMCY